MIGVILFLLKKLLALEKGLLPKKPLWADNGDGWGDSIIIWLEESIRFILDLAWEPHKKNTNWDFLLLNIDIILSVNIFHPIF